MANFLKEYTILAELGQGGFAKVYKVRHNALGYIRAIRVLSEPVTDESSCTYQKFLRECKVLLRLGNGSHRNIVHIYQPRLLENHALVEMDYVDGKDLSRYLQDNGRFLPADEVLRMVEQMSSALAYCHEDIYRFCMDPDEDQLESDPIDGSKWVIDEAKRQQLIEKYKVIHNDIHSGNIMRREDGSFVLLDFGLAITGGDDVRNSSRHDNGAVEYKAPEKWDDEALLTEQSDIYSFGVVMYEYLAGRVPFPFDKSIPNKTEAAFRVCKAHKEQTPPSIFDLRKACFEAKHPGRTYEKDYPDWLEAAIMKCLEKDPAKRFRNGKELHEFVIQHLAEQDHMGSPLQVAYVPKTGEQLRAGLDNPRFGASKEEQPKSQEQQGIEDVPAEKHETKEEEQTPSVTSVTPSPESTPVTQKATADKPQGGKGLWIVLAIVALVAVAALLFLLRPKYGPKSVAPDTQANQVSHAWVDLGLPSGTLWATCNVGASKPEDYGNYYAWGETRTKNTYNWDTYKYANGNSDKLTKYCNKSDFGNNGFTDNLTMLQSGDDPAATWGSGWHTPDKKQWDELLNNTMNKWTTINGVSGRLFTSKKNGQTLFLPAAGYRWGSGLGDAGSDGFYWSSSLDADRPSYAWNLCTGGRYVSRYYDRHYGFSVRPVREN